MTHAPSDTRLKFSALMEEFARSEGLSPNCGRILGYLLMSEGPVPFSDIASDLGISRGGVSENTRILEEQGIIERCKVCDDRRDHFHLREDCEQTLQERRKKRAQDNLAALDDFLNSHDLSHEQRLRADGFRSHLEIKAGLKSGRQAPLCEKDTSQ